MAEEPNPRSRGCFARLFSSFLFLISLGLAVALYFAAQPQDLSDVKGYGGIAGNPPRDLSAALRNATERGYDLRLSEEDLNRWLAATLPMKQGGVLGASVKLEGVAIRLEQDVAEVVMVRSVFGRPFTVSMFLRIEQTESSDGISTALHRDGGAFVESFPKLKKGGRFGKLVVPQGMLLLVMPSFSELKDQFKEEISNGLEKMAKVRIEEGSLVLDPRDSPAPEMINPF
ncbi:MAG: hypothetical protein EOP87_10035 [Verrucomicrobiaceae bacterium]|nr:MAG: hypothetical protein EOP87_10035 [Verrucomicrobiaceae bacterium]